MTRFSEDYDSEVAEGAWALWDASVRRAIAGKRGQKVLRDLEIALIEMEPKRLIGGSLITTDGEKCALGQYAAWRGYDLTVGGDYNDMLHFAKKLGLTRTLAVEIVWQNDEAGDSWHEEPERRHKRVLAWVRSMIATREGKA